MLRTFAHCNSFVAGVFALTAASTTAMHAQNTVTVQKPASADQSFIDMMVPHHEQAMTMAQQAVAKATRAEVRQMAEKMLAEQAKEIAQLKSWRARWFGSDSTPPPMMTADMPAGSDFDRMWLREVFKHHGMGVTVAEITRRSTARADIKRMAAKTSDAQHEDQHKIATWLREWYNESPPAAARRR